MSEIGNHRRFLGYVVAALSICPNGGGQVFGEEPDDWCGTMQARAATAAYIPCALQGPGDCPVCGTCDYPEVRDLWQPQLSTPTIYIRLRIHVICGEEKVSG